MNSSIELKLKKNNLKNMSILQNKIIIVYLVSIKSLISMLILLIVFHQ